MNILAALLTAVLVHHPVRAGIIADPETPAPGLRTESPSGDVYVLEDGKIFRTSPNASPKRVEGISDVQQILFYNEQLIALEGNGEVSAYVTMDSGEQRWHQIHRRAIQIEGDCNDLFALTERKKFWSGKIVRKVWRYEGTPGKETWHLMPITTMIPAGNGNVVPLITFVPMSSGVPIAFEELQVADPVALEKRDGEVFARTGDGTALSLSRPGAKP